MNKAFAHKEKCGCEYCNSGKKIQFALVKIKEKLNFISVYEIDALNSDKLTYKTKDIKEISKAEKNKNFLAFYGGIIYYSPDNIQVQEEIMEEVKNSKDHIFLYYDGLDCKYLGVVDIELFPEEMKKTKSTIKLIPCITKVILTESAKKILKNQRYLISSLNRVYTDRETNEETVNVLADNVIYHRKFGLVITSEEAKKKEENLAYMADKDKLKEIYNLLGM
ncbi:MAG: hypothetical protein Q4A58_04675 [Fusobacterium sp.]|uniref:hypothetical protein n=1 Tax=Fusobacterium sp. TaxID=68766 RepID=UPI0026DCF1C6|nr:hypothetical protein [Fusobacterium sp.]MDO4690570.1 hypothetical protein [Fusobacterium sp.]